MNRKLYVARSSDVASRRLGDEMLIMSGRDSTLFTLNEVAAIIWEAADGVIPLEDIVVERICSQFDVEPSAAMSDAEELADELSRHGILLLSEEPISQSSPPQQERQ